MTIFFLMCTGTQVILVNTSINICALLNIKFKPRTVKTLQATAVSITVFLWIRNPDPVRSVDLNPDSESGTSSGSRRAIIIHKSKFFQKFHVLMCRMFYFQGLKRQQREMFLGPPGSASGSVIYLYGSGFFYQQANK